MSERPSFLSQIPPVTRNLLYVNIVMFLATLVNPVFMKETFSMAFPLATGFRWWQPLTHMFMHDGWMHIIFNMYSLVIFGMVVERVLGTRKFIIFYLVTGFGAVLLHFGQHAEGKEERKDILYFIHPGYWKSQLRQPSLMRT